MIPDNYFVFDADPLKNFKAAMQRLANSGGRVTGISLVYVAPGPNGVGIVEVKPDAAGKYPDNALPAGKITAQ